MSKADNQRKQRSDAGQPRMTERDKYLFEWIAQQYAITLDHLQELVIRWNNKPVTPHTVHYLCRRWSQAGWAKRRKVVAEFPSFVWLTSDGLRDADIRLPVWEAGSGKRLRHKYFCNAVRLWVEQKSSGQAIWTSERIVKPRRKRGKKKHEVDAEVLYQDKRIAVEVELTTKNRDDLMSILTELHQDYDAVWYFATDDCFNSVEAGHLAHPKLFADVCYLSFIAICHSAGG